MDDIHLCPRHMGGCGGCGLNLRHPQIYDTKAGKYTNDMLCPICKGSGYDPKCHPDRVKHYIENVLRKNNE